MHFVLDLEVLNATEDASANVNRLTHHFFCSFYLVQCTSTLLFLLLWALCLLDQCTHLLYQLLSAMVASMAVNLCTHPWLSVASKCWTHSTPSLCFSLPYTTHTQDLSNKMQGYVRLYNCSLTEKNSSDVQEKSLVPSPLNLEARKCWQLPKSCCALLNFHRCAQGPIPKSWPHQHPFWPELRARNFWIPEALVGKRGSILSSRYLTPLWKQTFFNYHSHNVLIHLQAQSDSVYLLSSCWNFTRAPLLTFWR